MGRLDCLQADHPASSPGRGHRPRFTRPIQIVISTRAGRGAAGNIGAMFAHALRKRNHRVELRVVADLERARTRLVQEARDLDCLIGIGGDHTLSELGRVAYEAQVPLLGVPAGFGNILAGALGWRATVSVLTETLERGRMDRVDAGLCGDSLFLANQAFGFLEHVKLAVEAAGTLPRQRWRRYRRYVQVALRSIARVPLPRLRVDVGGETIADRTPFVIVANVPTYQGFLPLITDATPFDGLLDVLVAPAISKMRLVGWLVGTLVRAPACTQTVVVRRATQVTIIQDARQDHVRVLPRAVPVLLPPPGSRDDPTT